MAFLITCCLILIYYPTYLYYDALFIFQCNHWVIHSSVRVFEEWQAKQEDGTKRRKVLPRVVTTNVEHVATELPLSKLQKEGKIGGNNYGKPAGKE